MSRSLVAAWCRRSDVKNPVTSIEIHVVEDIFAFAARSALPPSSTRASTDTSVGSVALKYLCAFDCFTFLRSYFQLDITSSKNSSAAKIADAMKEQADNTGRCSSINHFLISSANEGLVGIQYPTFPLGGYGGKGDSDVLAVKATKTVPFRSPKPGAFSWCRSDGVRGDTKTFHHSGLESDGKFLSEISERKSSSKKELFYSSDCMDGRVHQLSGDAQLLPYLEKQNSILMNIGGQDVRCPPGTSALSPAFGELCATFGGGVFHAVPPFYVLSGASDIVDENNTCYYQPILDAARDGSTTRRRNQVQEERPDCDAQDVYAFLLRHALAKGTKQTASPFSLLKCCYLHVFCQIVERISSESLLSPVSRVAHESDSLESLATPSMSRVSSAQEGCVEIDNTIESRRATITAPFLGTGVRGWPLNAGARAAALACNSANEAVCYAQTSDHLALSLRLTLKTFNGEVSGREMEAITAFQESIDTSQFARDF